MKLITRHLLSCCIVLGASHVMHTFAREMQQQTSPTGDTSHRVRMNVNQPSVSSSPQRSNSPPQQPSPTNHHRHPYQQRRHHPHRQHKRQHQHAQFGRHRKHQQSTKETQQSFYPHRNRHQWTNYKSLTTVPHNKRVSRTMPSSHAQSDLPVYLETRKHNSIMSGEPNGVGERSPSAEDVEFKEFQEGHESKEFREAKSSDFTYSTQILSFVDSFLSWWSPSSSDSASTSTSSSSSSSSSSSLSSGNQAAVTSSSPAPAVPGQHNKNTSTSMDVTSAHARREGQYRINSSSRGNRNFAHALQKNLDLSMESARQERSDAIAHTDSKTSWSHDIMLRDRPVSHAQKKRKARMRRRTRKRKKRGQRSTKRKRQKVKFIGNSQDEIGKTQTITDNRKADEKETDDTDTDTENKPISKQSHIINKKIKPKDDNNLDEKDNNLVVDAVSRETTVSDTNINVLDTTTFSLNVDVDPNNEILNSAKSFNNRHLKNNIKDEESPMTSEKKVSTTRSISANSRHAQNIDQKPGIDLRIRTHQQKPLKNRGDVPVEEQKAIKEEKVIKEEKEEEKERMTAGERIEIKRKDDEKEGENNKFVSGSKEVEGESQVDGEVEADDKEDNFVEFVGQNVEENSRTTGNSNGLDSDDVISVAMPQTGIGIFATVTELVMTVKDLYAHQELNRLKIKELTNRFRTHRTDLHLVEAKVATLDQSIRSQLSTLQSMDATAGGMQQEMANFRNRQHRTDRNHRRLRLEMERLVDKVNRLGEGHAHTMALHGPKSRHMEMTSEVSKTNAKLELFVSRVDRLERLDYKRSTRTNKLNRKVDAFDEVMEETQKHLKDMVSEVKDYSGQVRSLRVELEDLSDSVEISMNPEFLQVIRGLGLDTDSIAKDDGEDEEQTSSSETQEYSGEHGGPDSEYTNNGNSGDARPSPIQRRTSSTDQRNRYSQDASENRESNSGTDHSGRSRFRKSRHVNSQSSKRKRSTNIPTSEPSHDVTQSSSTEKMQSEKGQGMSNEITTSSYTNPNNKNDQPTYEDPSRKDLKTNRHEISKNAPVTNNNLSDNSISSETLFAPSQTSSFSQSLYSDVTGNTAHYSVKSSLTPFSSTLVVPLETILKPTPTLFEGDASQIWSGIGDINDIKNTKKKVNTLALNAHPSSVLAPTSTHPSETNITGVSEAESQVVLKSTRNEHETQTSSTPTLIPATSSTPTLIPATSRRTSRTPPQSTRDVSSTSHPVVVERRQFNLNNTILQHHIIKLEQRIRTLESSMMKLTSSTVPGLSEEMTRVLTNHTAELKAELLIQKADTANQTGLLKEVIADNHNRSSSLEERFQTRETDLRRLKTITGHMSSMLSGLANQVSAINMSEFISRLQQSLANFSDSVITVDQWKISSGHIINTTIDHESRINQLTESIKANAYQTTKLGERVSAVHASSRRWFRNLQGHVIRLNNTVQDFKDHTEQRMQSQTKQSQSAQPSLEFQSKMDSLHIQLLYNSNRLSSIETNMLNRSLEQCRRTSADLEQQSALLRYGQEQKVFRSDLDLMEEKVQRIDLSVYRIHSNSKSTDAIVAKVASDVRYLKPLTSQVLKLEQEVDNLLHQVPRDCHAYYTRGYRESGVYIIYPTQVDRSIRVYCVMEDYQDSAANVDLIPGTNQIIADSAREQESGNNNNYNKNADNRHNKRIQQNGGERVALTVAETRRARDDRDFSNGRGTKSRTELLDDGGDDDEMFVDSLEPKPSMADTYNGGWTVIQRRHNGNVNFTKSWLEYATGFGRAADEYWLGNDVIHLLTNQNSYECRILMTDIFDAVWEARYDHFRMGGAAENFRLQVSGYHGNASDGLGPSNHMAFSTLDRDNDASTSHCALYGRGGWWYRHCHISNLNGPFNMGLVWFNRAWRDWVQMKVSLIMVKPRRGEPRARGGGGKTRS